MRFWGLSVICMISLFACSDTESSGDKPPVVDSGVVACSEDTDVRLAASVSMTDVRLSQVRVATPTRRVLKDRLATRHSAYANARIQANAPATQIVPGVNAATQPAAPA